MSWADDLAGVEVIDSTGVSDVEYARAGALKISGSGVTVAHSDGLVELTFDSDEADAAQATANAAMTAATKWGVDTVSSGTYSLVAADDQRYKRFTNATSVVVTVPANATTAIPLSFTVQLFWAGAAATFEIDDAVGVTINKPASDTLFLAERHSSVMLVKVGTDEWDLIGKLMLA
jgi:hypothetical protein